MSRRTVMPDVDGCTDDRAPRSFFGWGNTRYHKWQYRTDWNGNDRNVLPFLSEESRGIPRSGWRCFHCGKFVWDETDREYAINVALALGFVRIPTSKTSRNREVLRSFTDYCMDHPEERFWQALRNWCGTSYVYVADEKGALQDTFCWEKRETS